METEVRTFPTARPNWFRQDAVSRLVAIVVAALMAAAAASVAQFDRPLAGTVAVHRVTFGQIGGEYYHAANRSAGTGERVFDVYVERGGGTPFAYSKLGPLFLIDSDSDGSGARWTLGADVG